MYVRAVTIAAACTALWVIPQAAVAQHEHHRVPASATGLDTVTVRAPGDVVQLRSGATVVDARASSASGSSIAELLRTVPGVDVDAEGRLSMRGNTGVLVLMNGRRIALTGDALAAFLRQMPATSLERIEAGTLAPSQHDANAAAGVVNLVFRDDARRTGTRSLAASIATQDHYMGSASATGHVRDRLDWDAMYALSGMRPQTELRTTRWSAVPGDLALHTNENSRARAGHQLHSVLAGLVTRPAPNTSLELRGVYSHMEGASRNRSAFLYTNAVGNTGRSATGSVLVHVMPSAQLRAVATATRGRVRYALEGRTSVVDEQSQGDYDDAIAGHRFMSMVMDTRQRERALRSDVGLSLPGLSVDVGHESQFRTMAGSHDATHYGATLSQSFRHDTDIHAAWVTAQRSAGGLRADAGLRVEAERVQQGLTGKNPRTAVRLFPTVRGEWTDARRALVYRLAYGRRINRPTSDMLNPLSMGEDDMNDIIGNPSLLPEVSDHLELGIERHGARVLMQVTPFLRWTRDPIRLLKASTASGGSTTTLMNLIATRSAGSDGNVRARLTDATMVTFTGSIAHMETTAASSGSNGVFVTARLALDHQVTPGMTAQLFTYRRSAQAIEQGEILPAFTSALALTQRVAGDRGRVTVRVNDPSRSDRVAFRVSDATLTQESHRRTAQPLISLFASWAIGGAPREDAPTRLETPARIF